MAEADLVIVAADIEVDLVRGLPDVYRTSTGTALKKTAQELDKSRGDAIINRRVKIKRRPKEERSAGAYHRHLLTAFCKTTAYGGCGDLMYYFPFAFGEAFKVPGRWRRRADWRRFGVCLR